MSKEEYDHSQFKPEAKGHQKLADYVVEALHENDGVEFETGEIINDVAGKADMSSGYTRTLVLDGREWIQNNRGIKFEERPEGSGGNDTVFWRIDK